jgi:hypothetical protein
LQFGVEEVPDVRPFVVVEFGGPGVGCVLPFLAGAGEVVSACGEE